MTLCAPCTHQTNCHSPKRTVLCNFHSGRRSYVSIHVRQYNGGVRAEGLGGARMARQAVESCCAVGGDDPERLALTYERAQAKAARAGTQLTVKLNASVYRSFGAGHLPAGACCGLPRWAAC